MNKKTLKTVYAEFNFRTWDGSTNPFKREATTTDSESRALLKQFEVSFAKDFLQIAHGDHEDSNESAACEKQASWNSRMLLFEKYFESKFTSMDTLKFGSFDFCALLESPYVCNTVFKNFQQFCKVTCWVHRAFSRPFTALGPEFHLFIDQLRFLDVLDAARMVHELAHIRDAAERGWNSFQCSTFDAIERPALLAEKEFLIWRLKEQNSHETWESSGLRYLWNRSMAIENADLRYLRVVEELDPERQ